jgi:hypothetical protein
MAEELNLKNTKNEILEAYHEVLQRLKDSNKPTKQDQKIVDEKKEILGVSAKETVDGIVKNLAELKLGLNKSVEDIEEKLLSSQKKFSTLQQAIEIQTKDLEEIYEIKVNANSLSALLIAQREKSAFFEKEMKDRQISLEQEIAQRKLVWKKEQEEFELSRKEQESNAKKVRQREEEEYLYQRDITRQKERDAYLAEKQGLENELSAKRVALEKEFSEREVKISAQEQELLTLREKAEKAPMDLQKAIQETEKSVTDHLKFKFDYETKLAQKETEGERKLYQQTISSLEAKVAGFELQLQQLSEKANQSNLQVQDIAVKAIEGASRQRFLLEKSAETVKA